MTKTNHKDDISYNRALLAGGCFWCTEAAFEDVVGIERLIVGYSGGTTSNPNYEQVSSGDTDHYETLLIQYNQDISYNEILDIFWKTIDPFDESGQFYDRGTQYKTAIFYCDDMQKNIAQSSLLRYQENFTDTIKTKILPATSFYTAEEYHQNYHRKNPIKYNMYKKNSNREKFLNQIWQK
ncbi:MAG: peptide-methionine (S)-S-oxide reductase [Sphingobacteriaceae bacterium]|nr:MAG: peptide-methionine (S)-S-oxide reductase [Sphingobacteriaceae bacterium]